MLLGRGTNRGHQHRGTNRGHQQGRYRGCHNKYRGGYSASVKPWQKDEECNVQAESGERSRGRSRCRPLGLKGREIGMWYAERSKHKKKEQDKNEVIVHSSCK